MRASSAYELVLTVDSTRIDKRVEQHLVSELILSDTKETSQHAQALNDP
jgi:hypothetical protein